MSKSAWESPEFRAERSHSSKHSQGGESEEKQHRKRVLNLGHSSHPSCHGYWSVCAGKITGQWPLVTTQWGQFLFSQSSLDKPGFEKNFPNAAAPGWQPRWKTVSTVSTSTKLRTALLCSAWGRQGRSKRGVSEPIFYLSLLQ